MAETRSPARQPVREPSSHPVAPRSFYRLTTVADFLQFTGMRLSLSTRDGGNFEGLLHDLSASGSHLILHDIEEWKEGRTIHHDKKLILISEIDFVEVTDWRGKLP